MSRGNTKVQRDATNDCKQLVEAVHDKTTEATALAQKNYELITAQADMTVAISATVAGISTQKQQTQQLQRLLVQVLESNMKIYSAVLQMQELQAAIPPQVDRQQPIVFEDALGRVSPFHIEFINSFIAFQAVLEARFGNMPGLKKVQSLEYAMQDTISKEGLDLSKPWTSIFLPGRKIVMSMVFERPKMLSSCPGCLKENDLVEDGCDNVPYICW